MTELERSLVALGRQLEAPETPDLVPRVLPRLGPPKKRLSRRRLALALAFALGALLVATLAVPSARSALFRALHIGGEEIRFVDQLPDVQPPARLDAVLGERVSLASAQGKVDFRLRVLDRAPDRVYLSPTGTVWLWYGTPDRVKLLLAETPFESVDTQIMGKLVTGETRVEEVEVSGARGVFLSGAPHLVYLLDENGIVHSENVWLAREVLVWARGRVAYRLEGDLTRDEALRLASALR
jgi:hypothetical protein